jgi:hypothetical protein
MKTEYVILLILFIHWVADFLFQSEEMAKNKSKSNKWLAIHVLVYSLVWLIIGTVVSFFTSEFCVCDVAKFYAITFVCHFITDYGTSRWTSKLYEDSKFYGFPSFFSVIGLDQWLHYAQLIITYDLLKTHLI